MAQQALDLISRMDRLPVTPMHKTITRVCTLAWCLDGLVQSMPGIVAASAFVDLHLTPILSALIVSSYSFGLLVGGYAFSYIADSVGRRTVFQVNVGIFSLAALGISLSLNWQMMVFWWFVGGFGIAAMYAVDSAYIAEFQPPGNRAKAISMMFTYFYAWFFVIGACLLLVPPFFPSWLGWRIIIGPMSLIALIIFILRRRLPESVRFLISRNRIDEATKIVEQLEASAGPAYRYTGPPVVLPVRKAKANPAIFFKKQYRGKTLAIWYIGGAGILAGGLGLGPILPTIFTQGLGGAVTGLYVTVLVTAGTNVGTWLGRIFGSLTVDRIGRKFCMVLGPLVVAVSYAFWAYPFTNRNSVPLWYLLIPGMGTTVGAGVQGVGTTIGQTEIYPVEARSMAYGWGIGVTRISGIVGPLILVTFITSVTTLFYATAVLYVIGSVLFFKFIEETKGKNMEVASRETAYVHAEPATSTQDRTPANASDAAGKE